MEPSSYKALTSRPLIAQESYWQAAKMTLIDDIL